MVRRQTERCGVALVLSLALGCQGVIGTPASDPTGDTEPPGSRPRGGGSPAVADLRCDETQPPTMGVAPLRRLTARQYRHAALDVLGLPSLGADVARDLGLIPDGQAGFFASTTQAPDTEVTRTYLSMAEALAARFVEERLSEWIACDVAEDSCALSFIEDFGRHAFRRPLGSSGPEAETERYLGLYRTVADLESPAAAFEAMVTAMLASPRFLYHVDSVVPEGPPNGELLPLDGSSIASRLSFFLWSSTPDQALLDAAEAGTLQTLAGLEAEVRRMLADPKVRRTVRSFHEQWMRLEELEGTTRDDPGWREGLEESMREETLTFVEHVLLEGDGRLETLLTASFSFVDEDLADLYGVAAPVAPFGRVELRPEERAGILTHPSLMTQFGAIFPEVHRGLFVRQQLLCDPPPAPPANVPAEGSAYRLATQPCSGCHTLMDPIGFGFSSYDSMGRYRSLDGDGELIDSHGAILTAGGSLGPSVAGEFEGARELSERLAASPDVRRCMTVQWFRYAAGREYEPQDACAVETLGSRLEETGGDLRDLLFEMATSEWFRSRAQTETDGGRP